MPAPSRWSVALLAAAFAALAGRALGWLPWPLDRPFGFVPGDDWDVQLTMLEAAGRSWSLGTFPGWNPYTAGGVPLFANPEAPVLRGLLAAFFPVEAVARLSVVAHLGVLAAGTALLAGRLGAGRLGAAAAVSGLLTSDFLSWKLGVGHLTMAMAAWIPAALVATVTPSRRGAALAAACVAAAAWGGGPQAAWLALLSCLLLAGLAAVRHVRLLGPLAALLGGSVLLAGLPRWLALAGGVAAALASLPWRPPSAPCPRPALRAATATAVLALLLTAPHWLAAALGLGGADRFAFRGSRMANGDFSGIEGLASMFLRSSLVPLARVDGLHNGLPGLFTPVVLGLALAGAWALREKRPEVAALALLLGAASFGHLLPVNLFALLHPFPPLDRFRHPERFALVWVPLLCALSGVGAEVLAAGRRRLALLALVAANAAFCFREGLADARIAAPEGRAERRAPVAAPAHHLGDGTSNLSAARAGTDCLDCTDAVDLPRPLALDPGPYAVRPAVRGLAWAPGRIRFDAPAPGLYEVSEAHRAGWRGEDAAGAALVVDGLGGRIAVTTAREGPVDLRFVPPGLAAGCGLAVVGIGLSIWMARGRREEGDPRASVRCHALHFPPVEPERPS